MDNFGIPKELSDIISKADKVYQVGEEGLTLGLDSNLNLTEVKEKVLGKFSTNEVKFKEFISEVGNINVISNEAILDGKYISESILGDTKFKITIKDSDTFDFEEIDSNKCSEKDIIRYIEQISENNIKGFRKKSILSNIKFTSISNIKGKDVEFESYLVVEKKKPFAKLLDIINEDNSDDIDNELVKNNLATLGGKMKMLFGEDFLNMHNDNIEEEIKEKKPIIVEKNEENNTLISEQIKSEFDEAKKKKKADLQKRIDDTIADYRSAETRNNIEEFKMLQYSKEIELLESRIDSLNIDEPFNSYYFYIPESVSDKLNIDDATKQIIENRVKKIKNINPRVFMSLFNNTVYNIRFCQEIEGELVEVSDFEKIKILLNRIIDGAFYIDNNKLFFQGHIEWSKLNNKLIRMGFRNNNKFEELCQSS